MMPFIIKTLYRITLLNLRLTHQLLLITGIKQNTAAPNRWAYQQLPYAVLPLSFAAQECDATGMSKNTIARYIKILLLCIFLFFQAAAQKKTATITGIITDENDKRLPNVSVQVLNLNKSTVTNDTGYFSMTVTAGKPIALVFSFTGFGPVQKNFFLTAGESENIVVKLFHAMNELQAVTVKDERDRKQAGQINIDASKALLNPSPLGNIESLIKIFTGSNNELTSQYSVRGGSYDENLFYVNDFEIFRPYLVRSGQQEGLSFINPELTGNVKFFNGGFQAKYGDKMSSVLDVSYRKPVRNGGSAYIGLLEQGIHLEGLAAKNKVTYLAGVRNRSNRNLLSSQATKGNYIPSSSDIQSLITWQPNNQWRFEAFANLSRSSFIFFPEEVQLTSSVFSPLYSQNLAANIYFEGQEKDKYSTSFIGLSAIQQLKNRVQLKWMLSYFNNDEQEDFDISGAYLFGERDFDENSATYGDIINPLGAGINQNYARNKLDITVWNAQHKGSYDAGSHFLQWGNAVELQQVNDAQNEWEYVDSAGYSLPYQPSAVSLYRVTKGSADFNATRISGYIQDNIQFRDSSDFTLHAGVRYNYNTLNKEFLISPRVGFSFKPSRWTKDIIIKAAAGLYQQPPFFREMRRYDGTTNLTLRSQKSLQASAGFDYNFLLFQRPAKITAEAYYKKMRDVVPYDIDNVHIRYSGENNAKAYAAGLETRLYGELVKDAESWISIGFMRTKENLDDDYYTEYKNAAGEIIGPATGDKIVADSMQSSIGWLRRPTDRFITFGMFFQDYLSTNKNLKVFLNTLYGTNMPYNIPGSTRYRNALSIPSYLRVDIGFSALLLDAQSNRRSHSPFKNFDNIWLSLEVFNLIDKPNTISYQLIKDFSNNTFAMPNRLTPRLVNLKLIARW